MNRILICMVISLFYFFIHKGNNRLTVWYNHGIWLPKTTTDIKFTTYPDFIVITDDWSKSNCTMTKEEFQGLLSKLEWCNFCYGIGDHYPFPDSLKNIYPITEEFSSPIGDFLIIKAEEFDVDKVKVYMYTDWN